jgi:hypothetical protein
MHLRRAVDLKIGKTTNGREEDPKTTMAAIDRLAHHSIILRPLYEHVQCCGCCVRCQSDLAAILFR